MAQSVLDSETILGACPEHSRRVGVHYELNTTTSEVTKYYTSAPLSAGMAGATRVAVRKYTVPSSSELTYPVSTSSTRRLGDHLGSTSLIIPAGETTDSNGNKVSELRYKPCPRLRHDQVPVHRPIQLRTEFGLYFYREASRSFMRSGSFPSYPFISIAPRGQASRQA